MTRVTLYGKPGCCLCDEAKDVVAAVRAERPFDLEEVDITRDPALERAYRERIPVVAIDGEDVFELHVEARELDDRLAKVTP
ncbi:MAG: glutaredoxin family protein [Thermoleophilaceae bacterium]